jgi:hypothetical protein
VTAVASVAIPTECLARDGAGTRPRESAYIAFFIIRLLVYSYSGFMQGGLTAPRERYCRVGFIANPGIAAELSADTLSGGVGKRAAGHVRAWLTRLPSARILQTLLKFFANVARNPNRSGEPCGILDLRALRRANNRLTLGIPVEIVLYFSNGIGSRPFKCFLPQRPSDFIQLRSYAGETVCDNHKVALRRQKNLGISPCQICNTYRHKSGIHPKSASPCIWKLSRRRKFVVMWHTHYFVINSNFGLPVLGDSTNNHFALTDSFPIG